MLNILRKYFWIGLLGILACREVEIQPESANLGYEYYPLQKGMFWLYKVDTVEYFFSGDTTRGSFFRKITVTDSFVNPAGQLRYVLTAEKSFDTLRGGYLPDSTFTAFANETQAFLVENNRPILKLVFPIKENLTWNGDAFHPNKLGEGEVYRMTRLGRREEIYPGKEVATLTVTNNYDSSCVGLIRRFERYGAGVGLIFRERTAISYKTDPLPCTGVIEQGKVRQYRLIRHGKN
jgi:hypothetical protein